MQMETTDNWNNPYLLTDQLNGIICTKFPEMSSLFNVHVSSRRFDQMKVGSNTFGLLSRFKRITGLSNYELNHVV